ncbi:MAG: response regulator [Candidatus Saccharibacteria bacterium]|nr:response regulator [Candidatus Saccharibacteria bacterium]
MTKILLVEDDKSLREIYGVRLLAEGYDIVSAGDGEEALAMAIKERPSLIVSDVMMPKISGFDMLDILRSTTETKDIKVIMMTALSSDDQRQRGEQLGADRYLVKSQVGIEDVVRTVHEVLGDLPGMTPAAPPHAAMSPVPQPQPAPQQSQSVTPQPPVQPQPAAPQPAQRPNIADLSPQPATNPLVGSPLPQPGAAPHLPQPTAPFSSPTPRPSNLGERVIHPLENSPLTPTQDVAKIMEAELGAHMQSMQQPPQISAPQQPAQARSTTMPQQTQPTAYSQAPVNAAPQAQAQPTSQPALVSTQPVTPSAQTIPQPPMQASQPQTTPPQAGQIPQPTVSQPPAHSATPTPQMTTPQPTTEPLPPTLQTS